MFGVKAVCVSSAHSSVQYHTLDGQAGEDFADAFAGRASKDALYLANRESHFAECQYGEDVTI